MILGVSLSDAYRMRTGRESPTSGYDADRASRGLKKEGTDMSNSTESRDLGRPVRPGWVPSPQSLVGIRASLHEMNRSAEAMRAVAGSGDADFDDAWADLTEAYQDLVDRIRRPLDAEDWPGLVEVLIESRADFEALRGRDNAVQGKLCDVLAASIEESEAENATRSGDALIGGVA